MIEPSSTPSGTADRPADQRCPLDPPGQARRRRGGAASPRQGRDDPPPVRRRGRDAGAGRTPSTARRAASRGWSASHQRGPGEGVLRWYPTRSGLSQVSRLRRGVTHRAQRRRAPRSSRTRGSDVHRPRGGGDLRGQQRDAGADQADRARPTPSATESRRGQRLRDQAERDAGADHDARARVATSRAADGASSADRSRSRRSSSSRPVSSSTRVCRRTTRTAMNDHEDGVEDCHLRHRQLAEAVHVDDRAVERDDRGAGVDRLGGGRPARACRCRAPSCRSPGTSGIMTSTATQAPRASGRAAVRSGRAARSSRRRSLTASSGRRRGRAPRASAGCWSARRMPASLSTSRTSGSPVGSTAQETIRAR